MKRFALIPALALLVACGESPTEPAAVGSDMLAEAKSANAASVMHRVLDVDMCYQPIMGFPDFTLCVVQTGKIHETATRSGVVSFSAVNVSTQLDGYFFGEHSFSSYSEETSHGLYKNGEEAQLHVDFCFEDNFDSAFNFSTFMNVGNGQVRHLVETAEGC